MTHEEIADRIDAVLNDQDPHGTIDVEALERLRDELRPPRPEPGTVVWWRDCADMPWKIGMVKENGVMTFNSRRYIDQYEWSEIEWKPARILAPDEVAEDRLQRALGQVQQYAEDYTARWIDGDEDIVPAVTRGYLNGLKAAIEIIKQNQRMEAER